jgi:hypothetical protein
VKDLTAQQLRHLAVTTNRLAAMDGRALFAGMQQAILSKRFRTLDYGPLWLRVQNLWRYARGMVGVRAELARRGLL